MSDLDLYLNGNLVEIGEITNRFGDLYAKIDKNKYYWKISDETEDIDFWEEIPKSLYDELIKFENKRKENDG
jgi:hypothetical protein